MNTLTLKEFEDSVKKLGIKKGDVIIVHSSFKSMGPLENGADTVVKGFENVLGAEGTLVFPTLCQKDWGHIYENWHPDAPSDVGYLTEYFRKSDGTKRSNHATHSVAAWGKNADYITETHGQKGKRIGPFGDGAFAEDSPWEKMYELDGKILLIGAQPRKITHRHLAEYRFIDDCLKKLSGSEKYDELKGQIWTYGTPYEAHKPWAKLDFEILEERFLPFFKKGKIGQADCLTIGVRVFVDMAYQALISCDPSWFEDVDREPLFSWLGEYERSI
ncbi:MAG: AAC(3) family N-acetyltransferase [Monoglobales bacterium]